MSARSFPVLIGARLLAAGLGPIACSGAAPTAAPPSVPAPPVSTGDAIWMAQLQRTLDSAVRAVPLRGASAAVVLADG
ncbi:MAG: hypothetical protein ACK54K_01785, partial [Gemmatimonadaceae bacterium]